jgi:hypothetical protein
MPPSLNVDVLTRSASSLYHFARHVDALLVFPVAGREVRRPSVLGPKAKPELLEAVTVRGRGVEL